MVICVCVLFFCSSRRRHTRCALVTGVQTCALPIYVGSSVNQMHVSSGICQFTSEDAACKAGTDDQNSCLMSGHRYFSERQKVKSAQPVDGLRLANESLGMLRFRMGVRDDSATVGREIGRAHV